MFVCFYCCYFIGVFSVRNFFKYEKEWHSELKNVCFNLLLCFVVVAVEGNI